MATRTAPGRVLSEAQLQELLGLTKQADTVELKLTVPDANQRSAVLRSAWTRSRPRSGRWSSSTPPTSR